MKKLKVSIVTPIISAYLIQQFIEHSFNTKHTKKLHRSILKYLYYESGTFNLKWNIK